jgi:predicted transcriptional regulator
MSQKASTFRIDAPTRARLATLAKILHRPMNYVIKEALKAYLDQRGREVEQELEASLAKLRAYRAHDPDFKEAIAAFVEGEASLDDPVDGQLVTDGGPVRKEIDHLLDG